MATLHESVASVCPVCQSTEFDAYGGRPMARCLKCGALERGRLSWLILDTFGLLAPGTRVLNVAPEPFMIFFARKLFGESYVACDFVPEKFAKWKVPIRAIDLCSTLADYEPESFDVIMHNHVLEHIPCDVGGAIAQLSGLLAPGGFHLLSVPVLADSATIADLDPSLTPEEREERFGQDDHMRIFGDRDFLDILRDGGIDDTIDLRPNLPPATLARHAIPPETLQTINSNRVFAWRKPLAA